MPAHDSHLSKSPEYAALPGTLGELPDFSGYKYDDYLDDTMAKTAANPLIKIEFTKLCTLSH